MLGRFLVIQLTLLLLLLLLLVSSTVQFSMALVADQAAATSSPSHFRETSPGRQGTCFTEKGKDMGQQDPKTIFICLYAIVSDYSPFMTCVMMYEPFSKAWLQWKSMHSTAKKEREKESKAVRYFDLKVKRKTLCCWKSYMTRFQDKKKSQGHFISSLLFSSVLYYILACNITFHNTFEYISSLVHILI